MRDCGRRFSVDRNRGIIILDDVTLRLTFALIAMVLLTLFITTFLRTRSVYTFSWTNALAFLLTGSAFLLLIGTSHQVWAVPVGNALTVAGLVWAWRAARSLNSKSLRLWQFIVPPLIVGVASALDDPMTNAAAAGAPVRFAAVTVLMGLAAREIYSLDARFAGARRSLLFAAGLLSSYFALRLISFAADDFGSDVMAATVSETTTTVISLVTLITVSFSMAGLSHDELAERLRAGASRSSRQLKEGALVQQNLLPRRSLGVTKYPIAGVCVPSQALSGDFFDWEETEEGLIITVGDVMGKGVGAAMLGATIRAGLRLAQMGDPRKTVIAVMDSLGADLVENASYLTLFHAYLEQETGELTVLDAGHGLAVLVRSDGSRERIHSTNLPLGIAVNEDWAVQTLTLGAGDRLLVFSDGVLDLFDGSLSSIDQAAAIVAPDGEGLDLFEAVERIARMAREGDREDDVTVVAVEHLSARADVGMFTRRGSDVDYGEEVVV